MLGTLTTIIANDIAAKHRCFKSASNVTLDFEKKRICVSDIPVEENKTEQSSVEVAALAEAEEQSFNEGEKSFWADEETKLLIEKYKEHKEKFQTCPKKKVWLKISRDLLKHNVNKDGSKCDEKWRNLKKKYDKVRTENDKSGNATVSWKYFEDFQEIYEKDPRFSGACTSSSSGQLKRPYNKESSEENKKNKFSPDEKKRNTMSLKQLDARIQKRHEEKMDLKKDMLEWFKKNYKPDDSKN